MNSAAIMTEISAISDYMRAGKAVFTLVSKRSGTRFTYRVRTSDRMDFLFVDVLTGPENTSDYSFVGTMSRQLRGDGRWTFKYSHKADAYSHEDAPSVRGVGWLIERLNYPNHPLDPKQIEFWHSGRCARCRRELTDPESIALGLGPVCREKTNPRVQHASYGSNHPRGANPRNYIHEKR